MTRPSITTETPSNHLGPGPSKEQCLVRRARSRTMARWTVGPVPFPLALNSHGSAQAQYSSKTR